MLQQRRLEEGREALPQQLMVILEIRLPTAGPTPSIRDRSERPFLRVLALFGRRCDQWYVLFMSYIRLGPNLYRT